MKNWIRQQWKPALIAGFFMALMIGFVATGVGCKAMYEGARGMAHGFAADLDSIAEDED